MRLNEKNRKVIFFLTLFMILLMNVDSVSAEDNFNVWDGVSVEEIVPENGVYNIKTAAQLAWLAKKENTPSGVNFSAGKVFALQSNIDLGGFEWTPIGVYKDNTTGSGDVYRQFTGTFEGNGYTIKNLKIDKPNEDNQGIFGVVKLAQISNLSLVNSKITGRDCVGGIVGRGGNAVIKNCYTNADVTGKDYVAGIIGNGRAADFWMGGFTSSEADSCINEGVISGKQYVGGIGGSIYGVENSRNTGNIISTTESGCNNIGGIAGRLGRGDISDGYINNCINSGKINAPRGKYIGGIFGYASIDEEIVDCENKGDIYGSSCVGGVGGATSDPLLNCNNQGKVKGGEKVGGILGAFTISYSKNALKNTYNRADIEGNSYVGGIIGICGKKAYNSGVLYYSYNVGDVKGGNNFGSLLGEADGPGSIIDSYYLVDSCLGGSDYEGKKLSVEELKKKESFPKFDFQNIWNMGNKDYLYPVFKEDIKIQDDSKKLWMEENEAKLFLAFLYNKNPKEINFQNDSFFKLLTGKLERGSDIESEVLIAFVTFVQEQTNKFITTSSYQKSYLNDILLNYMLYLYEDMNPNMMGADFNRMVNDNFSELSKGIEDIMATQVSKNTGIEITESMFESLRTVKATCTKLADLPKDIEKFVKAAEACTALLLSPIQGELEGRYTYFNMYLSLRENYMPGGDVFDTVMEYNSLALKENSWWQNGIMSWLPGGGSWTQHRGTIEEWAETYYQLLQYQKEIYEKKEVTKDMFEYKLPENLIYDKHPKKAEVRLKEETDGIISVKYIRIKDVHDNPLINQEITAEAPTEAGIYNVLVDFTDSRNYHSVFDLIISTFKISKADPSLKFEDDSVEITYGDNYKIQDIVYESEGVLNYLVLSGADIIAVNQEGGIQTISTGIAFVKVSIAETNNYNGGDAVKEIVVHKATYAPNMPSDTLNVESRISKVKEVLLPDGWSWLSNYQEIDLKHNVPTEAYAIYKDTFNYENYKQKIILNREACKHLEGELVVDREQTCELDGIGHTFCVFCKEIVRKDVVIKKTDHEGGAATCTIRAECEKCGQQYGEINAQHHVKEVIKKSAAETCIDDGYTGDVYCADCGQLISLGTTIPQSGHEIKDGKCIKCGHVEQPVPPDASLPFNDISEDAWFYKSVQYVYNINIMTGLTQTSFEPSGNLARAQFAVIVHRINEEPEVTYSNKYADVPAGQWYTNAIMWTSDAGIVNGYTDSGLFGTGDNINREQMAVMMYRYAKFKGYDTSQKADFNNYRDAGSVNEFAKEAMQWAIGTGIISGTDNGTRINPQGNANRAECATIVFRFMEFYS